MEDDTTFDRILRETEPSIRAYIAGLGVPVDIVDDLAQEVYIEFYKDMHAMPADMLPVRWLKGIARNICMNYFRRSKRQEERRLEAIGEIMVEMESVADQTPDCGPQYLALKTCLQKLTPRQRQLIQLRYEEGLTAEKAAERAKSSAGTVRVTIFRLLRLLRECMTRTLQELPI